VGYGAFLLVKKILPKNKPSITTAASIAAFISVPAAVIAFVVQYAIGANSTFSVTAVFTGMMGTHLLIGIGEAVITAFAVTAVMASRPDLVYGYRGAKQQLEIRKA
jgi:ABC-type Co2+ transport system permease subunit